MADTIVEWLGGTISGTAETRTLKLFALGSDVVANGSGDAGAEATNRKCLFLATVDDALTGWHHAHVFDDNSECVVRGYVKLNDDTGTYRIVSEMPLSITLDELTSVPDAEPTAADALMALLMALRNKLDITSSLKEFHNDAGSVVWQKALSDDGTTYSEAEGAAP